MTAWTLPVQSYCKREKIQVLSACWRASKCFEPNTVCVSLKAAILDSKVLSPWTERYYFSHRVRGMPWAAGIPYLHSHDQQTCWWCKFSTTTVYDCYGRETLTDLIISEDVLSLLNMEHFQLVTKLQAEKIFTCTVCCFSQNRIFSQISAIAPNFSCYIKTGWWPLVQR